MPKIHSCLLTVFLLSPMAAVRSANFAESVINYQSGTEFGRDFSTGLGLTNSASVLGEPSRSTPGAFEGPVNPFNPPFLASQILSIGTEGSLTIRFAVPVPNSPDNPRGIDFMIYGNSGFMITNGNYSGGGVTDGSLFGNNNPGTVSVEVSRDNENYFSLNPSLAPAVSGLFPTDGAGSFQIAVDPALTGASFAGRDLAGIRTLYGGSAGGAGFDLAWAIDSSGAPVSLSSIQFVRLRTLAGAAEIDGFSAVPEPVPGVLLVAGACCVWGWNRLRKS